MTNGMLFENLPQDNPTVPKEKTRLSERIEFYMKNLSLNQVQVAEGSEIPLSTLHYWLTGGLPIADRRILKLARFFKTTLEDLLFGPLNENEMESKTA